LWSAIEISDGRNRDIQWRYLDYENNNSIIYPRDYFEWYLVYFKNNQFLISKCISNEKIFRTIFMERRREGGTLTNSWDWSEENIDGYTAILSYLYFKVWHKYIAIIFELLNSVKGSFCSWRCGRHHDWRTKVFLHGI
jgi:hypothetical protein